jgi:ubiquinone/menaquinone biosynthesis C-methylase UbiE
VSAAPSYDHAHDEADHHDHGRHAEVAGDDHGHGHHGHKHGQADHYDHIGTPEFEIHRPHREGSLYRFLMRYKFQRAIRLLPWPLEGRTALSLCCGSGMDAEMLERSGAQVVALDISQGALLRARERARAYGLSYHLVRGDAEHLPFRTGSVDVSFVHDGLHHLPKPELAIAEMARVASTGVVITEPADAALTRLCIAVGLVPELEDSGNEVMRFEAATLGRLFGQLGFDRVRSARYLVKYGHPPAGWWRIFDYPPLFRLARAGFLLVGQDLLGRFGNKLSVAAARTTDAAPAPGATVAAAGDTGRVRTP